jgi:hypothetical protein
MEAPKIKEPGTTFNEPLSKEFWTEIRSRHPAKSMKEMRGFLKGLDTTIEREDDRL